MITTAERCGKEDPRLLLIAAHMSGLYEMSTQNFDLIGLLESASSFEDYLVG